MFFSPPRCLRGDTFEMANNRRTEFTEMKYIWVENCLPSPRRVHIKASGLRDLIQQGLEKLDICPNDEVHVVLSDSGLKLENEESFMQLDDFTYLTLVDVTREERWNPSSW